MLPEGITESAFPNYSIFSHSDMAPRLCGMRIVWHANIWPWAIPEIPTIRLQVSLMEFQVFMERIEGKSFI